MNSSNGLCRSDLPETRGEVNCHIPVPLLESVVFLDIMKIIPSDDNRSLHFHLLDDASKDPTPDGHIPSKWTLLVNVGPVGCLQKEMRLENLDVSVELKLTQFEIKIKIR